MKLAFLSLDRAVKKFKAAKTDKVKANVAVKFFETEAAIVRDEMLKELNKNIGGAGK